MRGMISLRHSNASSNVPICDSFTGLNTSQGQLSLENGKEKVYAMHSSNTVVAAHYQATAKQPVLWRSYEVQLQWSVQDRAQLHSGVLTRSSQPYVRLDAVLESTPKL